MADSLEMVLDAKAVLGEGAIWHAQAQKLYWIDILQGHVHIYDPATNQDRNINVGQIVGTVVPRASGGLIVAVHEGIAALDLETEKLTFLARPEADNPKHRFNDGKCDPSGRFWAGTMVIGAMPLPREGTLYCLDAEHRIWPRLTGTGISNGIVWTKDRKTMYYNDTMNYRVDGFDYDDATGAISNRRVMFRMPEAEGLPDGMCIDENDNLWIAIINGGQVVNWDPVRGKLLNAIKLPTIQSASCAFGGPNLDELYITTGTTGLDEAMLKDQPLAGALFKIRPGVKGVAAVEYAG